MSKRLRIVDEMTPRGSWGGEVSQPGLQTPSTHLGMKSPAFKGRVAMITLGCAKNQVDSEVMLGVLEREGFEIVSELDAADIAIVNTCGFLESAVTESIDRILDAADHKESGRLRKLIVSGCMVERYRKDLEEELPEVDAFLTTDDLLDVARIAEGGLSRELDAVARPYFLYDDSMPRRLSTRGYMAYVKVSEGCNRPCTFCIIPRIRGAMRSRQSDSLVAEVQQLAQMGVREVNLVAQDLTSYGKDVKGAGLEHLIRRLDAETGVDWIRLLYAYPIGVEASLLHAMVELPKVCKYLDMPLQHASEAVLRRMQRPIGRYGARRIIEWIRSEAPSLALRTTFIVGFPGETEEDVQELEQFVREGHFLNVGVFCYSPERGTPSFEMEGQIPAEEKESRRARIMQAQQDVLETKLQSYIGQTVEVLIEGAHEDTDLLLSARASFQAPEVDGNIIINDIVEGLTAPQTGEMGFVQITEVAGYDLVGCFQAMK
jgi:ribosomal protein S12 methylthiotransferase